MKVVLKKIPKIRYFNSILLGYGPDCMMGIDKESSEEELWSYVRNNNQSQLSPLLYLKSGKKWQKGNGSQNYLCKSCGKQFVYEYLY